MGHLNFHTGFKPALTKTPADWGHGVNRGLFPFNRSIMVVRQSACWESSRHCGMSKAANELRANNNSHIFSHFLHLSLDDKPDNIPHQHQPTHVSASDHQHSSWGPTNKHWTGLTQFSLVLAHKAERCLGSLALPPSGACRIGQVWRFAVVERSGEWR